MLTQKVIDIDLDHNLGEIDDLDIKNKPNPITHIWLFLPSALLLLIVELLITHMFYTERIGLQFAVVLHLCVLAFCLGWTVLRDLLGQNINIPVMALTLIGVTGALGAFTIVLIILIMGLNKKGGTPFSQWYYSLFPGEDKEDATKIYDRLYHGLDDLSDKRDVVSFDDVMNLGTYRQKQEVISKIVNHYTSDFSSALKLAINDPVNAVRVQAATAISKILDQYGQTQEKLLKARHMHPKNHKVLINLARHTHAFARNGLLDEQRSITMNQDALNYFQEYHALYPNDPETLYFIGTILVETEKYNEALPLLKQSLELRPEGTLNPLWISEYCECLFRLGQYDDLKHAIQLYIQLINMEHQKALDISESLSVWEKGIPLKDLRVGGGAYA